MEQVRTFFFDSNKQKFVHPFFSSNLEAPKSDQQTSKEIKQEKKLNRARQERWVSKLRPSGFVELSPWHFKRGGMAV